MADLHQSQRVLLATDNDVARKVADHLAEGMSFNQIMEKYKDQIGPENEAEVHEAFSRIQAQLRDGIPYKTVINSVFTDPGTREEAFKVINEYKANRASASK